MIQIPVSNDGSFVIAGAGMSVAAIRMGLSGTPLHTGTPSWAQTVVGHIASEDFFYSELSVEEIKTLLEQADEA